MMDIKGTLKAKIQTPLLCWDIYSLGMIEHGGESRKIAIQELKKYQFEFSWQIDLNEVLRQPYDALVLTDHLSRIKWVNDGFYTMTGYTRHEVLDKSPKILQGLGTTIESTEEVSDKLSKGEPFTSKLTNYRKNGEEYICSIEVYPLFDKNHALCHFLALENEVRG